MNPRLRILFLPRWYPNRYDPMPGLFIQRQAEALSADCDVAVVYVHPDPHCPNKLEVDFAEENMVRVMRVYYLPPDNPDSFFGRIANFRRFYHANMKAIKSIKQFAPDVVHGHILTRMGVIAMITARKFHAPFVISEHWSRYFPGNNTYKGLFRKLMTGYVVQHAAAVVAVSDSLRKAMINCGLSNPDFRVIPNVTDTERFNPQDRPAAGSKVEFVHISCFEDRSKNISGFLRSLKELAEKRRDFKCLLVGTGPDFADMKEYAGFLKIPREVYEFTGLLEGAELSGLLKRAGFSVVSSRYETFGTVVIESLACGTPVLSTTVGISPDVVTSSNGLLVPPGDEPAMTMALATMLDSCGKYDPLEVSRSIAGKFDQVTVGKLMGELYRDVLKKN